MAELGGTCAVHQVRTLGLRRLDALAIYKLRITKSKQKPQFQKFNTKVKGLRYFEDEVGFEPTLIRIAKPTIAHRLDCATQRPGDGAGRMCLRRYSRAMIPPLMAESSGLYSGRGPSNPSPPSSPDLIRSTRNSFQWWCSPDALAPDTWKARSNRLPPLLRPKACGSMSRFPGSYQIFKRRRLRIASTISSSIIVPLSRGWIDVGLDTEWVGMIHSRWLYAVPAPDNWLRGGSRKTKRSRRCARPSGFSPSEAVNPRFRIKGHTLSRATAHLVPTA